MPPKKIALFVPLLIIIISAVGYWEIDNISNDKTDTSRSSAEILDAMKNTSTETSEPTTAVLKVVDYGPAYLRLEQETSSFTARFLLMCFDGQIHLNAGILTTPERSEYIMKKITKNYLEFDSEVILPALKNDGAKAVDSAIWIARPLDSTQVALLKTADVLGAWTEDGSDFRWGAYMFISNVRNEIHSYLKSCSE
jgi:hypothetical protein